MGADDFDACPTCGKCRCERHRGISSSLYCCCPVGKPDVTVSILEEAQRVVFGPRQGVYGHPRDDFARIAGLWNAYLLESGIVYEGGRPLLTSDVPQMMILLKMARLMETPTHRDSIVDEAGYAETAARVVGIDE